MNVELLKKVKAHILEEPMRVYMGDWYIRLSEYDGEMFEVDDDILMPPACGTVACICGWAAELSGSESKGGSAGKRLLGLDGSPWFPESSRPHSSRPRQLADTPHSQAQRLFFNECWPAEFRDRLKQFKPQTPEYAQVVADRIDHFIATDGKD